MKYLQKISRRLSALPECLRLLWWLIRREEVLVPTFGSYGDLLMVNGVLREYALLKKRRLKVVFKTPVLSYNLPFIAAFLSAGPAYFLATRLARHFRNIRLLNYGVLDEDRESHLMQRIAQRLGFQLAPGFKPFYLMDEAKDRVEIPETGGMPLLVIQSSAKTSHTPYKNWMPGRMETIAGVLQGKGYRLQLGAPDDSPLPVEHSSIGKLNIRQSFYVLSKARLFVGLEGALMHAAGALGVPAVIVYGGYIHPQNSAYSNIRGIASHISCAPCFKTQGCPYQQRCMVEIGVEKVLTTIDHALTPVPLHDL